MIDRNKVTRRAAFVKQTRWIDFRRDYLMCLKSVNIRAKRGSLSQNTPMQTLSTIVAYADKYLRIGKIPDYDHALNGLQVENSGRVSRMAAAVDASTQVLREAAAKKADLLIVHHGLFWAGSQPVTGPFHRQLDIAFEHDIAVYSAHLPLDAHPKIGNNALLATSIGLKSHKPFLEYKGSCFGLEARGSGSRQQLVKKLERSLGGPVKAFNFGPENPRRIAIVTGGAGSEIHRVAEAGIDTFITGEAPHWAAVAAAELEMNLLLGGHYATETFGVKALAAHLAGRFDLPWQFIDAPTGL
jgi:dinuclear metal center YbgI/SA1388 family protein